MHGIQSSLFTAAITLCVFSAGLFSEKRTRAGRSFVYFTSYLIIESLGFAFGLLMSHPATPLKALWLGLLMASSFLVAPCLWLAIRESVEGVRPRVASLGRGQISVILAGMALTLPLIETAHLGVAYENPWRVVGPFHSNAIHAAMLLSVFLFAWQVPFYLWRCRRALLDQLGRRNVDPANADTEALKWIKIPLVIVFTSWVVGVLRTLHCALTPGQQESAALLSVIDVSVTIGAIYVVVSRASSASNSVEPVSPGSSAPRREDRQAAPAPSKYARSTLDVSVRARIKDKLESAMGAQEVYRDSLLSLRSLSAAIQENAHYVSQVLNQELNSNFYELVNRHRIELAQKLLVTYPERTVLDIALSVGFNSKSTFNSAFRRQTGTTPRQYRSVRTFAAAENSDPA